MSLAEMKEKIVNEVNHLDNEETLQQALPILTGKNELQTVEAMHHKDYLFKKHDGLLERLS